MTWPSRGGSCSTWSEPGRHTRLSTTPGDILPDDVSTPRGMAITHVDVVVRVKKAP